MIMSIITILATAVYGLIFKGWVKAELSVLHNRMNSLNNEMNMQLKINKDKAQNAQAIASNVLSCAQRAEYKVSKQITTTEEKNA